MNLTAKVTTVWVGHTGIEWEALRDIKIQELVASGKTDGVLIQEDTNYTEPLRYHRMFINRSAAQEFVDWWNTTAAPNVASISITDI